MSDEAWIKAIVYGVIWIAVGAGIWIGLAISY